MDLTSEVMMCLSGQKEHDIEWRSSLPYNPQAAGFMERDNGIVKQQIKLLTGKTMLAGWTEILPQATFE